MSIPRVRFAGRCVALALVALPLTCGCASYAERGTLFGGLTGAGVGALVGNALGDTGAGAAIGAGVGALTGAAVGGSLDEIEARNRAQIAAQLGREIQAGAVTNDDVVAMTRAGVADGLIMTHIQHNGLAAPVTAADLIHLKQCGVSEIVLQTMQSPPPRPVAGPAGPPPVTIVEEHVYGPPPFYGPPPWPHVDYHYHHGGHWRPRTHWGISVSN